MSGDSKNDKLTPALIGRYDLLRNDTEIEGESRTVSRPGRRLACEHQQQAVEEDWPYMTTKRKLQQWLKRRRTGEFYFRSEMKGLVYSVMTSRGWHQACAPRVNDEDSARQLLGSGEEYSHPLPVTERHSEGARDWRSKHSLLLGDGDVSSSGGCTDIHDRTSIGAEEKMHGQDDRCRAREWDVHWSYTKWAVETMRFAKKLAPWQRVNHFRNSNELCRKDLMLKNLKKRKAHLYSQGELAEAGAYNFIPLSFEMPKDYPLFVEAFREMGGMWIMKPSGSAEGRGIFLFTKLSDVRAWAKPHLIRGMRRTDHANPGSFVVQRYISNPLLVGGKKFDLRLYVLVTSFRPLTVYIYRDGFAKFSSMRFSNDPEHLRNEVMHLTNHAVQRRAAVVGKKWSLKRFKLYVAMRHGRKSMDRLFWEIQCLVIRTLRAVDRLIINDKQSFELFGYDVMVDDGLRPWLLEVNASPSLGASSKHDLRLKKQMVGDVFDIIDVEERVPANSATREHVGGFDLVFHKGYVEVQPKNCGYSNLIGAVTRNLIKLGARRAADKDKFSTFPLPQPQPWGTSMASSICAESETLTREGKGINFEWRTNILMYRPENYWSNVVEYTSPSRGVSAPLAAQIKAGRPQVKPPQNTVGSCWPLRGAQWNAGSSQEVVDAGTRSEIMSGSTARGGKRSGVKRNGHVAEFSLAGTDFHDGGRHSPDEWTRLSADTERALLHILARLRDIRGGRRAAMKHA